jgi:hypothetical protein
MSSTTDAPRDGSDFFLGLEKAASKGSGGAPNTRPRTLSFSREKIQARTDIHLNRQRKEAESMRERKVSDDYMKHMHRKWRIGDTYAPHDLHPHQMAKHRTGNKPPRKDVVDELDINPLDLYKVCPPWTRRGAADQSLTQSAELLHDLRVHDARRQHQALQRIRPAGEEPEEDGKGHQADDRHGPAPQRAPPPRDHHEEGPDCSILSRGRRERDR